MQKPTQVKTDVINELRNRLYYNQIEIQRLINNSALYSHQEVVDRTIDILKENVLAQSSIELMEAYLPKQKEAEVTATETVN